RKPQIKAWGLESRALPGFFISADAIPDAGHGETTGPAALEVHHFHQTPAVFGQTEVLLERWTIIVRIAALHDEGLLDPTTSRGRYLARSSMSAMPRGAVLGGTCVRFSFIHRLANHAVTVRCKGHDTAYLLDFQLFAGPTQAFAECAQ